MTLYATFDHRVLDGAHAAKMVSVVKEWLENPFDHFDPLDGEAAPAPTEEATAAV
jgi:pyruvate dehydrogenase E2 component (dihydrolipoamide acetyltransferase)